MIDENELVWVGVSGVSEIVDYWESLGYSVPKEYCDNLKRFVVRRGTTMCVRVKDLRTSSLAKVNVICDTCGSYSKKQSYSIWVKLNNSSKKDMCKKCKRNQTNYSTPVSNADVVGDYIYEGRCYENLHGHTDVSLKTKYRSIRKGGDKRSIDFSLTYLEFLEIMNSRCYYCGNNKLLRSLHKPLSLEDKETYGLDCAPRYVFRNGIDRFDNHKGYHYDNCVACCPWCNIMKNQLSIDEFIGHINKISEYTSEMYPTEEDSE